MRNYSANPSRCPARRLPDEANSAGTPLAKMIAAIRSGPGPVDAYVICPQQIVHPFYQRHAAEFERAYGEPIDTSQPRPAHFPPAIEGETSGQYLTRWLAQLTCAGLEIHSVSGRVFSENERRALGRYDEQRQSLSAPPSTQPVYFNDSLDGLF